MALNIAAHPPATAVRRLLEEAALPAADLTDAHLEHFYGSGADGTLEGVVGLELYPPVALLRSLAVAPHARRRGIATALIAQAERQAREHGAREMYLLTTTAEHFFARAGYERIARDAAPEAIRATQEFAALCPVSAALMRKRLT
jgi:amino-acid N-acetyltransferase